MLYLPHCFEAVANSQGGQVAALWWSPFLSHSNTCTLTFKVLPIKVNPYPLILWNHLV